MLHIVSGIFSEKHPSAILYLELEGRVTDKVAQAPFSSWKEASWFFSEFFYDAFQSFIY